MEGSGGGNSVGHIMASSKCLLLVVCLLGLRIEPSWSSCSVPSPIANATIQMLPPHLEPVAGKFGEGAELQVECLPGFRLPIRELKYQTCSEGEWVFSVKHDTSICVPQRCQRPPAIINGHYTSEHTNKMNSGRLEDSYPLGTILEPSCEASFTLNCSGKCGRISCGSDGTWTLTDGRIIAQCFAEPLRARSNNLSRSETDDERESPTKNYLVLGLAAVCILGLGTLTVALLRRPTFCKKVNQNGPRVGGGGGHHDDAPVMMTSSSPVPYMDSLPVSMNTGIFVPGASYDLQDCHFQDSPLVGTTVFK